MDNKQIYIDFIVEELSKGNISFERVFELILTKFNLSRPTFSKYWKLANEAYLKQREAINKAKLEETIKLEKEAVRIDFLSKEELVKMVENVAKLSYNNIGKGQGANPAMNKSFFEATALLSKLQGYDAPIKQENKNTIIEVIREDANKIE